MSNLVKVNKMNLEVKVFKGQRVVTFKDIDNVHQRPSGTAGRNFRKNKKHFIENEDYFVISPSKFQSDEIRCFGISSPKGGFLITETGYLMLVKSFTDDLAWSVQRELVKNYFRAKEQPQENQSCTPTTKLYKGVPIVTLEELSEVTGLSKGALRHAVIQNCSKPNDYEILRKLNLVHFRKENGIPNRINALIVVFESGVKKLAKIYRFQPTDLFDSPKLPTVPIKEQLEKLTKASKGEDYEIKHPLEVLHKLMNISKERGLDLTLRPFKAFYSILASKTIGLREDLPIHQIIYEIAFELAHSILHKGQYVVGNHECNQKAHQIAVSFIKTLDVLSTQ